MSVDGPDLVMIAIIIGYIVLEISRHRAVVQIAKLAAAAEADESAALAEKEGMR